MWIKLFEKKYCSIKAHLFIAVFCLLLLTACSSGVYHTVKPGQNLYRISQAYGVSEERLAYFNRITDPTKIRSGTRLYIPGADRVRYVPAVKQTSPKPGTSSSSTSKSKSTSTTTKPRKATVQKTAKAQPKTTAKPSVKSTEVKKLHWPLRGKIVRSFSAAARSGGGKGIEIGVRSGSVVKAAEAGKVIYSGDGVNGYGHLIILQHENDLFTVYGFNQRNYVRQGDFVSQGEKIALSGVPPSGGAARLHFEVRKGKQAVNPILYLP